MATKTVITWNGSGGELDRRELPYEDATTEALAQALIDMISSCMSVSEGDRFEITTEG